ncbi:hypothetical protein ACE414_15090 [Alteromonas macleodii]|uniref:hypothetical protein n=1 Tax=Alteromonadales TaxID=135622 RepID=UPI00057F613C|nr:MULTISPECIES: hypothetical protein [Alteromonadales]MAE92088.1 hypothetical protein [Pelagibaca sp.]MBE91167.1 hypothetical protein [Rhodospirillaceae bacterium]OLF74192.1 hypothetical protein AWH61_13300 [Alteromonas sp. W12]KHT54005.1 hypothetical protein RJ44_17760 [Alteromonas macleodii]MBT43131.1 hypothetical protein [Idiomarina sp.]|tara:strand:- start:441 stop:629 length:189 start_codon:yes stop_codon:yes gene_type:complete
MKNHYRVLFILTFLIAAIVTFSLGMINGTFGLILLAFVFEGLFWYNSYKAESENKKANYRKA